MFVHAPTKDAAVENSEEVIRIMHDTMKTDLNPLLVPPQLLGESIPGQKVMKKERTTNHPRNPDTDIRALTMSGVFTTVEVGHKYGYFVGFYGATPVFFDPTLLGKRGKPQRWLPERVSWFWQVGLHPCKLLIRAASGVTSPSSLILNVISLQVLRFKGVDILNCGR